MTTWDNVSEKCMGPQRKDDKTIRTVKKAEIL